MKFGLFSHVVVFYFGCVIILQVFAFYTLIKTVLSQTNESGHFFNSTIHNISSLPLCSLDLHLHAVEA